MKAYTDIEQSKKLAEILPKESADMYYFFNFDSGIYEISIVSYQNLVVPKYAQPDDGFGQVIPCWSLSALMELIPFQIIGKNERYGFRQLKGYNTQGETYYFEYISSINQRLYETYHWNNPLDAAFEMVCWLKKEEYI